MYWPTKHVLMLLGWSALNLSVAYERLDHGSAFVNDFWSIVISHSLVVAVPWGLWWWARPHRRLRSAAAVAISNIRREAILLGPAFDELAVEAECLWQECGVPGLRQHRMVERELSQGAIEGLRDGRGRDVLEAARDEALANVERTVTALELLSVHLAGTRLCQVEREVVTVQIDRLQRTTTHAISAQEEATRALTG